MRSLIFFLTAALAVPQRQYHDVRAASRLERREQNVDAVDRANAAPGTFIPATRDDLRSPCPALNTAANIGVLPRNGRDVSLLAMAKAMEDVYNVEPGFAYNLSVKGFATANPGSQYINLLDLAKHNIMEHDASLTRKDAREGDDNNVQAELVAKMLQESDNGFVTIQSLAKTRIRREQDSIQAGSPPLDEKSSKTSYAEAALVVTTLRHLSGKQGNFAPNMAVREWMQDERLPTNWVKPPVVLTAAETMSLAGEILALTKQKPA